MAINYDDLYSYTKLDTYEQCPYKFKLIYVDKKKSNASSMAMEVGTLIHETEESIANCMTNNKPIDYISLKNNLIERWIKIEAKYPKDAKEIDKSGRLMKDKIYYYLSEGIYTLERFLRENPELEVVAAEKKFSLPYKESYVLRGSIDRLFRNKATGKYIIQDIKTYNVPKEKGDLTTPLQFVVYVWAAEQIFGIDKNDISCQYYLPFVADEKGRPGLTQDAGTAGYIDRGLKKLNAIFSGVENKEFKPKLGALCNYCPYCITNPDATDEFKLLCPYHSLWTRETRIGKDSYRSEIRWEGPEKDKMIVEAYMNKYRSTVEGGENDGKGSSL